MSSQLCVEIKRSFFDGHLGLFQEAEEAELLRSEDQERVASAVDASGRPAHPVDVLLWTQSKA